MGFFSGLFGGGGGSSSTASTKNEVTVNPTTNIDIDFDIDALANAIESGNDQNIQMELLKLKTEADFRNAELLQTAQIKNAELLQKEELFNTQTKINELSAQDKNKLFLGLFLIAGFYLYNKKGKK